MLKIGLCFTGQPYGLRQTVAAAQTAEMSGYDSVWVAEDSWTGRDAITALSCIAFNTSRVRVGTSLIGTGTRNPVLTAITFNSLWEVARGRLVLGIGLAHGWHAPGDGDGRPIADGSTADRSPLTTMRTAVASIRALAEGREVPWGESTRGMMIPRPWFEGAIPPMNSHLPIYIGAVRPRMTRLAGEIGDGILLEMEALRHELPARLEQFRAGAREAGRDPDPLEVVKLILTSVSGRGEPLHPNALGWATKSVARLDDATVTALGWDLERVDRIRTAWLAQDWERGKGLMTSQMIRTFVAAGPAEECLRVIEETVRSGVTLPVLIPYGGNLRPILELGVTYAAG